MKKDNFLKLDKLLKKHLQSHENLNSLFWSVNSDNIPNTLLFNLTDEEVELITSFKYVEDTNVLRLILEFINNSKVHDSSCDDKKSLSNKHEILILSVVKDVSMNFSYKLFYEKLKALFEMTYDLSFAEAIDKEKKSTSFSEEELIKEYLREVASFLQNTDNEHQIKLIYEILYSNKYDTSIINMGEILRINNALSRFEYRDLINKKEFKNYEKRNELLELIYKGDNEYIVSCFLNQSLRNDEKFFSILNIIKNIDNKTRKEQILRLLTSPSYSIIKENKNLLLILKFWIKFKPYNSECDIYGGTTDIIKRWIYDTEVVTNEHIIEILNTLKTHRHYSPKGIYEIGSSKLINCKNASEIIKFLRENGGKTIEGVLIKILNNKKLLEHPNIMEILYKLTSICNNITLKAFERAINNDKFIEDEMFLVFLEKILNIDNEFQYDAFSWIARDENWFKNSNIMDMLDLMLLVETREMAFTFAGSCKKDFEEFKSRVLRHEVEYVKRSFGELYLKDRDRAIRFLDNLDSVDGNRKFYVNRKVWK